MDKARQTELIHRIFAYLDAGTTTMADGLYRNPALDYTCPEQNARERERLFRERPLVICAAADVRNPGDYVTDDHTGVPLLVVRGRDGELRAFANTCRHRASRIAEGRGTVRRAFTCPFHGWTYDTAGNLAGVPYEDGFDGLERACHGLLPRPVTEKHGLVWVRPAGDTPVDPDALTAGMEAELAPLALADFHPHRREVRTRQANWKAIVDTFLETYHFPVLHKNTVNAVFKPNCGPFDGFGPNLRLIGVRRTIDSLRDMPEAAWDLIPHATIVWHLFPNTMVILQMGHLELWRIFPGPDPINEATFEVALYAPEEPVTDKARRHWDTNLDLLLSVTEQEDFVVSEQAQQAFRSQALDEVVFGRNEPALAHFHKAVAAAVVV